jgi:hypothetical protein
MGKSYLFRVLFWSFAAVAAFAVVFTVATLRGSWPGLPYRALRDLDLAAGFVAALLLAGLAARAVGGSRRK